MIRNIMLFFADVDSWELALMAAVSVLLMVFMGVLARATNFKPSEAERLISALTGIYWSIWFAIVISRLVCGISAISVNQEDGGAEELWVFIRAAIEIFLYFPFLLWMGRAGYFCYAYSEKRQKIKKESLS